MARMMKSITCMVLIAAVLIAAVTPPAKAAISCGTVVLYLYSCIPYVTNKGPLGGCCNGIKRLYNAAQTTPDKQSVCNCLKSLTGSNAGIDYNKATGLPDQCGVDVPYEISPSTDCSKVQ